MQHTIWCMYAVLCTSARHIYRPFSKWRHKFACFVTVGKRNRAPNVKDRAFAVCQKLSVGFRAVGFAISLSKELNSTQGWWFNKEQDVWLRRPSHTKWKAKKLLACSSYFCPRGMNCFSAIVKDEKRLVATACTRCRSDVSDVRGQTCRGVVLLHTSLWSRCVWRRKGQRLTIYATSHPLWSMLPSCNEACGSSNDWLPHLAL